MNEQAVRRWAKRKAVRGPGLVAIEVDVKTASGGTTKAIRYKRADETKKATEGTPETAAKVNDAREKMRIALTAQKPDREAIDHATAEYRKALEAHQGPLQLGPERLYKSTYEGAIRVAKELARVSGLEHRARFEGSPGSAPRFGIHRKDADGSWRSVETERKKRAS